MLTPGKIAAVAAGADVQTVIATADAANFLGETIWKLSVELVKPAYGGMVPTEKEVLLNIVGDTVAGLMMQHVFGSTQLAVGIHTRKVLLPSICVTGKLVVDYLRRSMSR